LKGTYKGLPVFVWILFGLLALSGAVISLGQRETTTRPAADSFAPSGTSAFVSLLEKRGYKVRIDRWQNPRLSAGDLAIAFKAESPGIHISTENESREFFDSLKKSIENGTDVILLPLRSDFEKVSREILTGKPVVSTERGSGAKFEIAMPANSEAADDSDPLAFEDGDSVGLWDTEAGWTLRAGQFGKGRLLQFSDGSFATNRFIDHADDARAALSAVSLLAKPGSTIVFTEAAYGNVETPSLLELIGPWALAGWQQLLFLGLIVVATLGTRFGIPDETRPPQRGARELLDAVADTYLRGRQTKAAMDAALYRTDNELRTELRLPRDATLRDRDSQLPPSLQKALYSLHAASEADEKPAPETALRLISAVRRETEAFLQGDH